MIVSKNKTIVFNFTNNYQFGTQWKLQEENVEIVNKMKLLGTWVITSLTRDENCSHLIKKVNGRMRFIRTLLSFGASKIAPVDFYFFSVTLQSERIWMLPATFLVGSI